MVSTPEPPVRLILLTAPGLVDRILPSALAQNPPLLCRSTVRLLAEVALPVRVRVPPLRLTPTTCEEEGPEGLDGVVTGGGAVLPLEPVEVLPLLEVEVPPAEWMTVSAEEASGKLEFAPPWSLSLPEPPMIVFLPVPATIKSLLGPPTSRLFPLPEEIALPPTE